MTDTELLVSLAAIAGVFVGFGALISSTGGAAGSLWLVRSVVNQGLMVIAASLVPVLISRFGVAGHDLWFMSSLVILVADWAVIVLMHSRREHMAFHALRVRSMRVVLSAMMVFLELPSQVALALVLLGVFPGVEPALYLAAVVLWLFQAAVLLVMLVYSKDAPGPASPREIGG